MLADHIISTFQTLQSYTVAKLLPQLIGFIVGTPPQIPLG